MTKFYPELIWTIVSAPHIFQTYQNHKAIEINWKHKIKQQQHQLKIEYLQRFHLHCVKVNPFHHWTHPNLNLQSSQTLLSKTSWRKGQINALIFFTRSPLVKKPDISYLFQSMILTWKRERTPNYHTYKDMWHLLRNT